MKILRCSLPIIISALVLSSCSIGPDFETQEPNLPEMYTRARLSFESLPTLQDQTQSFWWKGFRDDNLEDLISKASTQNLSIQSAVERIEEASANTRGTYFGLIPQFTLGSNYVKNKTAAARFPGITRNGIQYEIYSLNGQASWEVDLYGKIRRQIEGSQTIKDTSIYNLADLLRMIQAQVGTTYIQLRGLQKRKEVVDHTINNQIEIFKIVEAKFNLGQSSAIDLERAKTQLETTKASGSQLKGQMDSLTATLSTLTREPIVAIEERLSSKVELPNYKGPIVVGSPSELLRKRPDVRVAEEAAHLATTDIGVAWSNFLPQVAFNGTLSRDARSPSDWSTSAAKAYNYGPSISWSILNLGTIINQLDASKSAAKASMLNYQSVVVKALEEVEIALSNLSAELERSEHLENAAKSSQEAYRLSELQYRQGILSYSDLLLSEQEKLQAESDYIDSHTLLSSNYVNFYKAIGGAWEEDKEEDVELLATKENP